MADLHLKCAPCQEELQVDVRFWHPGTLDKENGEPVAAKGELDKWFRSRHDGDNCRLETVHEDRKPGNIPAPEQPGYGCAFEYTAQVYNIKMPCRWKPTEHPNLSGHAWRTE